MCEAAGGCFIDQFKNWSIPLFLSCAARRECKRIPPSPPRRRGLHIVRDDVFFFKANVISHSFRRSSLYYRVVVIRALLQGVCYTVRDAVDWFAPPTTRWFWKGSNHSPLQFC